MAPYGRRGDTAMPLNSPCLSITEADDFRRGACIGWCIGTLPPAALDTASARMRCGIRLRHICWLEERIYEQFRNYLVTCG